MPSTNNNAIVLFIICIVKFDNDTTTLLILVLSMRHGSVKVLQYCESGLLVIG